MLNAILTAGTGRADITPPPDIAHVNWGARVHERAEGIDLPLWATVLLLDSGGTRTAIVDLDFLLIPTADCTALRALVAEAAGLEPQNVRLSVTHTHAGPPWSGDSIGGQVGLPGMEQVPAYRDKVRAALAAAARQARAAMRPARAAAATGTCDVTVSRRLQLPDGRMVVGQNWDGETDRTLTVLRLDDHDERPIATIVGYGTHPIVLAHQNRLISPDYPGTVKRTVESLVGGTCLFLQGCAGDQIPRKALTGDTEVARRMGTMIGVDAAHIALRLRTKPVSARFDRVVESGAPLGMWVEDERPDAPVALGVLSRVVDLPVRDYGPVEALAAEAEKRNAAVRDLDRDRATPGEIAEANTRAKRASMNARWARVCAGRAAVPIELHAIRVGDAVFVGSPLEPFARLGVELRAAAPGAIVQLAGYTNGWEGYVPTAEAFPLGGYEAEWASPFAPEAGAVLVAEARKLVAELLAQP